MGALRTIFGPSEEKIWKQLSSEINAEFVDRGFWKGGKVIAKVEEWTVMLDTYYQQAGQYGGTGYTRMRAPYVNKDGFRFTIYRKGLFSEIGKLFGMQDIEVGYPNFDRDFIIKSNAEDKVRMLFSNPRIRKLIQYQPAIYLQVKDDEGWFGTKFPEGVDELYFQVVGVIKDVDRLKSIYELFAETLNQLCHIGSAYEDDPNLIL